MDCGEKARLELQFGVDIWLVVGGTVVIADRSRLEAGAIVEEIDTGNEVCRGYVNDGFFVVSRAGWAPG